MIRKYIFSFCLLWVLFFAVVAFGADQPEIFVQLGHSNRISSIAFSPDGNSLVSSGRDKTVRLWDIVSERELTTFRLDHDPAGAFFSVDGRGVYCADVQGTMRLRNIRSGREMARLNHGTIISAVARSADGKYAVSAGGEKLVYWDLARKTPLFKMQLEDGIVWNASFSADGKYILLAWSRTYPAPESAILILDVQKRKPARKIQAGPSQLRSVAMSPDGRYILAGSGSDDKDSEVRVWEAAGGNPVKTFRFQHPVFSVAFSPDGIYAAAGSYVNSCLFRTDSWEKVRTVNGVLPVLFSRDGRTFIHTTSWEIIHGINSYVETIRLTDRSTGAEIKRLGRNAEGIISASFVDSGRGVAVLGLGQWSWDLQLSKQTGASFLRESAGNTIVPSAVSPDGRYGMEYTDNGMRLWEMRTGKMIHAFSKDGTSVMNTMRFSHQGKYLLVGNWEGTLTLWDMERRMKLRTFSGKHERRVTALAFSPDDRYAFSGGESEDKTIRMWDVSTGILLKTYAAGQNVTSMEVSPDGVYLLAGGFSGDANDVILWNIASGAKAKVLKGHHAIINAVAFSHDSQYVLSGDFDKTIKLWDVRSGRDVRTFAGHTGIIASLEFSPDDTRVVSAGRDGTTRLWQTSTGREIAELISFTDGEWIVITPEGYYNASAGGDRHLNVRVGDQVYGIENFREAFFRPDLVKTALAGGSLRDFRKLADVKEPPVVKIVDTPSAVRKDEVTVRLRLTDQGGGIGDIRLYLNGTAVVMDSRAVTIRSKGGQALEKPYALKLVNGKNIIKAIAFNGDNSMQSNEAVLEVTATFAAAKPSLTALVIGINEFKNPKLKLQYPVADANLFASTLQSGSSGLFDGVTIRRLTKPEETTQEAILREIKAFQSLKPDDLFVFYIASHGTVDEGEYFLITSNVGSLRTERLKTDAISQHQLKEALANIPATKKLIVIDTCNAGALGEAIQVAMMTRGMSEDTALKILSRAVGSTILSASTSLQEALEGYQGHGLFTYVLTEGLKGKADKSRTGYVKTTELADYVDNEVPQLAEKVFKRAQYPTISISGQAFPIGKVK